MTRVKAKQIVFSFLICFLSSTFCKGQEEESKNTFEGGIITSKGLLTEQYQRNILPLNDNLGVFGSLGMGYTPGSHEENSEGIGNSFRSTIGSGLGLKLNKLRLGVSGEYNKAIGDKAKETDTNFDFITASSYVGICFTDVGIKLYYLRTLYTNQEFEQDNKNGFGFTIFYEF